MSHLDPQPAPQPPQPLQQTPQTTPPIPLIIGITGPSCSGKTTLTSLLHKHLPAPLSSLLHQDDFYLPDALIPQRTLADGRSVADWDCRDALDVARFVEVLRRFHREARLEEPLGRDEGEREMQLQQQQQQQQKEREREEKHAGNAAASPTAPPPPPSAPLDEARIAAAASQIEQAVAHSGSDVRLLLVDGFLLVGGSVPEVRGELDVRVLLGAHEADVAARRAARGGYVTQEGFWVDPEGYVGQVVWANYVAEHRFLFVDGDVGGNVDVASAVAMGVNVCPAEAVGSLESVLEWVVESVVEAVGKLKVRI